MVRSPLLGHHTEYWDHHTCVNTQYSAPEKLNIQYLGIKILNIQHFVAVWERQHSIFSKLNSIFKILWAQRTKFNILRFLILIINIPIFGVAPLIHGTIPFLHSL